MYGGAVANPINILNKMIASLHDENNHITIPVFYDKVIDAKEEERKEFIQHHLLDSHDFHIFSYGKNAEHSVGFPLPVILWDNGIHVFSSSKFS